MNTLLTHVYFYLKPSPRSQDYVQAKLISKIDLSDFKRAKDFVRMCLRIVVTEVNVG